MTLIEILIVVALIALLSGTVVFGSGMLKSTRLRSAAGLIVSGVRLAQTRASASGKPVRMVFDIDHQRVMLEEAKGSVMLRKKEEKNTGGGADPATEAEQAAHAEADRILQGVHSERASFEPVKQFGFDGDDAAQGRSLGDGIRFRQVQTEHDLQPRTEGRAYLYVWPGGETERVSIQLFQGGEDPGLTVSVSPLTGRAQIDHGKVDLPEARSEDGFSEREEEP
jgi:general secretion pathway protein H